MAKKLLEQHGICPVATTIDLLNSKWKILILRDLSTGEQRYTSLKTSVAGVSQKMLTQSLREMEEDGLVLRTVFPTIPPKVVYALTDLGKSLEPVINSMAEWGDSYLKQVGKKKS